MNSSSMDCFQLKRQAKSVVPKEKVSFEGYYEQKHSDEDKGEFKMINSVRSSQFRNILTEMNGRIKSLKKHKYEHRPQTNLKIPI